MSDEQGVDKQRAWCEAWVAAWAEMPEILKTHTVNTGKFSYSYAGLAETLAAVRPILNRHGFAVAQSVEQVSPGVVGVVTSVYHKDGWSESFGPTPMPAEGDPRSVGSAITYARRYALSAALGVASEDDTDAAGTEGKRRAPRSPAAPRKAGEGSRMAQDGPKANGQSVPQSPRATLIQAIVAAYPDWDGQKVKDALARLVPVVLKANDLAAVDAKNATLVAGGVLDLIGLES